MALNFIKNHDICPNHGPYAMIDTQEKSMDQKCVLEDSPSGIVIVNWHLLQSYFIWNLQRTIMNGLLSFMLEEFKSPLPLSGSIQESSTARKKKAKESGLYNLEMYPVFIELFPGKSPGKTPWKFWNNLYLFILELASEIVDHIEKEKWRLYSSVESMQTK